MKRWIFIVGFMVLALVCAIGVRFYISSSQTKPASNMNAVKLNRPIVYLALGDSACTGVGSRNGGGGYAARLFTYIKKEDSTSRMVAPCVSGARSENVVREQLKNLSQVKPTLVTVGIGANDVINFVDIEQFTRNFEEIISRLKSETDSTLIVMNIPDVSLAPVVPPYLRGMARERVVAFNERIETIAKRENLTVVNLYDKSREFSLRAEFFSEDGFHPSDAGYDFWAKELWVYVENTISEETD
jgi:acyl-CoA thioesterase I